MFELKSPKQQFHEVQIALPQVSSLITVQYNQFSRVEAVVEEVLNLHMHEMDVREGEFGLFHPRLNTRYFTIIDTLNDVSLVHVYMQMRIGWDDCSHMHIQYTVGMSH